MNSRFITRHILNRFIEVVDDIGAQPLFVYLATGDEIIKPALASYGEKFFQQFCQQNKKVDYFSTRKDFLEATRRGTKLKTEGHWDSAGHWIVANSIKPHLDKLMQEHYHDWERRGEILGRQPSEAIFSKDMNSLAIKELQAY